jgi:hypothetical protein
MARPLSAGVGGPATALSLNLVLAFIQRQPKLTRSGHRGSANYRSYSECPLLAAGSTGRRNTIAPTEAVDFLYMSQIGSREFAAYQKPGVVSKLTARFQ